MIGPGGLLLVYAVPVKSFIGGVAKRKKQVNLDI
jgi:hypothetical protein